MKTTTSISRQVNEDGLLFDSNLSSYMYFLTNYTSDKEDAVCLFRIVKYSEDEEWKSG